MDNDNAKTDAQASQVESSVNTSSPVVEKRFTQDEVNSIVGNRAKEAAEKARREAEVQYEARLREQNQVRQQQQASQAEAAVGNSANLESQIESLLQKKAKEQDDRAFNERMNVLANEFTGKVNDPKLKEKYSDYDSVLSSKKMERYPNTILMTNELSNTADVYYHLLKHPEKLATIENTAKFTDPDAAKDMIKKISADLQKNEDSQATYRKADEPLSRMKPGTAGVDNGKLTVSDYKKMFRN